VGSRERLLAAVVRVSSGSDCQTEGEQCGGGMHDVGWNRCVFAERREFSATSNGPGSSYMRDNPVSEFAAGHWWVCIE
jgi:hypothetical protein